MIRSQGINRMYVILHVIIVEIENDLIIRTGPISWYEYLCTFIFIYEFLGWYTPGICISKSHKTHPFRQEIDNFSDIR